MTIFASEPLRYLQLHELTRQDMFKFVRSEFQGDERSTAIRAERRQYFSLVEGIVERADGIFLWVSLVTYEMLKSMGNYYSSTQLHKRLENIPKGLDGIFRRMFDTIHERERESAANILLVMKLALWWPPYRCISIHSMMDEITNNPSMLDIIMSGETEPQTTAIDWEPNYQGTATRLIARCNGLVEVAPFNSDSGFAKREFQFVHRSVSDFLNDEEIHVELLKLAGGFCPWTDLVHSMLAVLKFDLFSFSDHYRRYTVNGILEAFAKAEHIGLPPFTKEMDSFIQICRQWTKAKGNGYFTVCCECIEPGGTTT